MHGLSTAVYAYGGYVYGTKTNQVNFHEGTQYQLGPVSTVSSLQQTPRYGMSGNHNMNWNFCAWYPSELNYYEPIDSI